MDDSNDEDRSASRGGRSRLGGFPVLRAAFVLVVFTVGVVLLLATVHTSRPAVVANAFVAAPSSTSTSTTVVSSTTSTTTARNGHRHPSTTTTSVPVQAPANVPLLVANGSGVSGAAAAFSARLHAAGWTTLPPTNASAHVTSSRVYYLNGQQAAATTAAAMLHIPAGSVAPYSSSVPVSGIGTAEVLVVLGPDVASSAASTTTSSAAGASPPTTG